MGKPSGSYLVDIYRWRKGVMQKIDPHGAPIERMGINLSGTGNWGFRHADRPVTYLSWDDIAYVTGQPSSGPPKLIADFYKKRDYAFVNKKLNIKKDHLPWILVKSSLIMHYWQRMYTEPNQVSELN
ncbi:hypothetical protein NLA05_21355 [Xanthomonas citri pv. anacardii]|uniref:hypothetical protein n=2 Tax=Xanthomonas citri TaxID=346 RepID=UPI001D04BA9B|nr:MULTISPECIES: hypothetical protein [Xanthomonas]MEE5089179.1 hypothetical protein [Xanthomonas euvesicatoria]MCT8358779.1 hypothetical protein [Xanthomonas citri pv. anacardii]MCT8362819.1 hypothetical protein [Xanthomonas citri pv. anacardii]MCT8366849.1 hypothetical protein [Xanthomonas citri pv. anacardii]MCT8370876.1 hypothetical protein [Xanthomonas citri pv. anacardii]